MELFVAYPNPAKNVVQVQVEMEVMRSIEVTLFNSQGAALFVDQVDAEIYDKSLDISSFPAGIYRIRITVDDQVTSKPLIKLE